MWYYYYRSFVEWKHANSRQKNGIAHSPPSPAESQSTEVLVHLIEKLQHEIHALQSPPPIKSEQQNGEVNTIENMTKKPIGFFTEAQLAKMRSDTTLPKKSSVQACTGLYSEKQNHYDDLYTVKHEYKRGSETVIVRYTEQQIRARLQQWQREVEDAQKRNLGHTIIRNRKSWVQYWEGKLFEVQEKKKYLIDT